MFERMRAGWRLARSVRKSVMKDKGLFGYSIISGIVAVAIFIFTFLTLIVTVPLNSSGNVILLYVIGLIIAYIAVYFFTTLILIALLLAYRSFVSGNPMGMRISFSGAWKYRKEALEWALFYSTVVLILRMIESRFRGIAQIVIGAVGSFIIAIATFFAIPSIIDYKCGPIKAIEHSVETIRKNYGQAFGGMAYVDLYSLIFVLAGVGLIMAGFFIGSAALSITVLFILIVTGISLVALGAVLNFTFMNVFKLVLFDYNNGKGLPEGFNEADINGAIRRRRSTGGFSGGSI